MIGVSARETVGLLLLAVLVYGALIVSSFYNDDSPVQFRCHQGNAYTAASILGRGIALGGDCELVLVRQ